jgi:hypothetical protein
MLVPDYTWRYMLQDTTLCSYQYDTNKQQTPLLLVCKRIIPTERPPLVDEILVPPSVDRGVSRGQYGGSPTVVSLSFLDRIPVR